MSTVGPPQGNFNSATGTPPPPSPVAVQQTTVIQVAAQKSVVGAVLLAFFFGPLGMLYVTVPGALIMFVISFFVAFATLGLGLLITLPICAIWAGFAASSHNNRMQALSTQQAIASGGGGAAAGWHDDPGGSGRLRYYDGMRWTNHYAEQASPQQPPAPAAKQLEEQPPEALEEDAPAETEGPVEDERAKEEPVPQQVASEEPEASDAETQVIESQAAEPQRVFCGTCGAGIAATARFCSACGKTQAIA
jgi:hypothetical protein